MTVEEWERITAAMVAKHWPRRYAGPSGEDSLRVWFEDAIGTVVADVGMILDGTLTVDQFETPPANDYSMFTETWESLVVVGESDGDREWAIDRGPIEGGIIRYGPRRWWHRLWWWAR